MLQRLIRQSSIRFYHDAKPDFRRPNRTEKMPQVRVASMRVNKSIRDRRHAESQVGVSHDMKSGVRFEPFPFAVTEENKLESAKRAITPLFDVPYEEQLSAKESYCRNALRILGQELYKGGTPVRLDVRRLPCHVKNIIPSPVQSKYRNKDELSIWRGHDGKTITAGFMIFPVGKHGDTVCVEPNGVDVIRDETIAISDLVQEFLREQAKLGVCLSLGVDGGWRRFMVRVNTEGELMLIGILNPRTLRVREVLEERDNFKEFMVRRSQEQGLKLASLYYQPCPNNHCRHRDVPYELLHGNKALSETIGNLKIMLSPESYLHNSTQGARTLYEEVKNSLVECFQEEYDALGGAKPLIINLNSGAGVLSLHLAQMASHVIGIDRSEQSVDDARSNASLNGIENVEFIPADPEIVIERVLEKHKNSKQNLIVTADISNSGLHKNVVSTLKQCHDVNKILLILPKLDSNKIMNNLIEFCSKSSTRSLEPFAPILAVPVDTCPQTQSFQTILVLERLPE